MSLRGEDAHATVDDLDDLRGVAINPATHAGVRPPHLTPASAVDPLLLRRVTDNQSLGAGGVESLGQPLARGSLALVPALRAAVVAGPHDPFLLEHVLGGLRVLTHHPRRHLVVQSLKPVVDVILGDSGVRKDGVPNLQHGGIARCGQ